MLFDKAQKYTQGLLVSPLRNIEQICDSLPESDYYQMQHFVSNSNWDASQVIALAARETNKLLPRGKLTGLIIDETGIVKQGEKSIGVGWQYCGNVGKLANSQVAVVACLNNSDYASMVDARLYLPEAWISNPKRCKEAGLPKENRVFKTKIELAYEIIVHQLQLGISFDYVGADGYYGNDANFANKIDQLGLIYMLDIHSDQPIYLEKPELFVPDRKSSRGREPKRLKASTESITVTQYYECLEEVDWQKIKVRNTAKGTLVSLYHFQKVYIWNKQTDQIESRVLVIRRSKTKTGEELKYSFTNAEMAQYTPKSLAYMQAQRFFIEHCIKECKQVLGLDQFQTRKWIAWYHQVALNIMTMAFMLKEKLLCFYDLPLLSARDIRDWITYLLMKDTDEIDVLQMILKRHLRRQADINRCYINEYA